MPVLERLLIEHCSPTLANLKTANLFRYTFSSTREMELLLHMWNQEMNPKGASSML